MMLLATLFAVVSVNAQSPEYMATLQKMLSVSGTDAAIKAAPEQMIRILKQQDPNMSEALSAKLKEWMEQSLPDLIKMMTPVYAECYTQKDLEDMIAFYQTPLGQKIVASQPKVVEGMSKVLPEWSAIWTPKLLELMKEAGQTPAETK